MGEGEPRRPAPGYLPQEAVRKKHSPSTFQYWAVWHYYESKYVGKHGGIGERDTVVCALQRQAGRFESDEEWAEVVALLPTLCPGEKWACCSLSLCSSLVCHGSWILLPSNYERIGLHRAGPTPHWLQQKTELVLPLTG